MSFADLYRKRLQHKPTNKKLVSGTVVNEVVFKSVSYFCVDIGAKYQGIIPKDEIKHLNFADPIKFLITGEREHYVLLSYEKAKKEEALARLKTHYEKGEKVQAKIVAQATTGSGYKCLVLNEISALLQTSETYELGLEMDVYVIKIFPNGNVFLSTTEAKIVKLEKDDIVKVTVLNFNDYFVSVAIHNYESKEGVIHISDLSHTKIDFPGEVVTQGQVLDAKVLKIQNNCVYLGLKQILPNPWLKVKERFSDLSQVYTGIVKRINDYELVVDMGEGATGTIHISEISWGFKKRSSLNEEFKIDQEVSFKILEIDTHRKRIRLSIKHLLPNPFFKFASEHKPGDVVTGTVLNDHSVYGTFLFIELQPSVDGILHQSEMDWNPQIGTDKFMNLSKNQQIKVQIINIDQEKMRVSVSVKRLNPDFFEIASKRAQLGKIYDATIEKITFEGLEVKLLEFPECNAFIKKNEISNDKNERLRSFSVGDVLQAKLIVVHNLKRAFYLSVKARQIDENKEAIKGNKNSSSSSSFGDFFANSK